MAPEPPLATVHLLDALDSHDHTSTRETVNPMSIAPAAPQAATVHRRPKTEDLGLVASATLGVPPLADLVGNVTEVTFSAQSDLGPCEACVKIRSIAVATVTYPDPQERDGEGEITVCRDCLGRQVDTAAADSHPNARVAVEAPVWSLSGLIHEVGDAARGVQPLLVAENIDGRPGYLADEVAHAHRLLDLDDAGLTPLAANTLLRQRPDLAHAVETTLRSAA